MTLKRAPERRHNPHSFLFATGIDNSYPTVPTSGGSKRRVHEMAKCGHYDPWHVNPLGLYDLDRKIGPRDKPIGSSWSNGAISFPPGASACTAWSPASSKCPRKNRCDRVRSNVSSRTLPPSLDILKRGTWRIYEIESHAHDCAGRRRSDGRLMPDPASCRAKAGARSAGPARCQRAGRAQSLQDSASRSCRPRGTRTRPGRTRSVRT
jgi:hypothetical protein